MVNVRFDQTNAAEPRFIAMAAARSKARRILLVIDACHSGATIGGVIAEIANVLGEQSPDVFEGRGIAVITSAHAIQKAQSGVVCRLLGEALTDVSYSVVGPTPIASSMAIGLPLL